MSSAKIENIINLSSEDEDDVEIIAFKKETQDLIDNPVQPPHTTKKLSNIQCPICFDEVTNATATSCGHVFVWNAFSKVLLVLLPGDRPKVKRELVYVLCAERELPLRKLCC